MRRLVIALALVVVTTLPVGAQRDRAALTARLDSLARAWLAAGPSAGASIAVVQGRDTLLLEGIGEREHEHALPATPTTVYRIGSITKQFTSSAIMQLVEQGKIGLGDPITKFLPEYPQWGRVTVRQLLNHTSGIHSYTSSPEWAKTWDTALTPAQIVAFVAKDTFDFAPGTQYRYNNTGYVLLGMILDRVTGTPYPQLVPTRFFKPLGMRGAGYCPSNITAADDARGYDRRPTAIEPSKYMDMSHPYSAGALCMSVVDYLRWQAALTSGRVVSPASYALMSTSDTVAGGRAINYGFGLAQGLMGTHRVVQHTGGVNGFNTAEMWFPDDSLQVVVFSNTVGSNPNQLARALASAVLGLPLPAVGAAPPPPASTAVARMDSLSTRSSSRRLAQVAWLAGCWESKRDSTTIQEQWMPPLGNTMLSVGRTVRGDSLADFELTVIRAVGNGLVYEAHPAGQASAVFRASSITDRGIVFENRQHDFPQQVAYERRGADSVVAWVAGPMNGRERRIEFPYARARCP